MNRQLTSIYNKVLTIVASTVNLPLHTIRHSRRADATLARAVLVHTLLRLGFTEMEIASLSNQSQQRINSLKNTSCRLRSLSAQLLLREVWSKVQIFNSL